MRETRPSISHRQGPRVDNNMSMRTALGALLVLGALLPSGAVAFSQDPAPDREAAEFFEKKIRPVLVERCHTCHSAQAKKLKGSLLLDTRAGILKGGDTGPALVPGHPEQSLMIKALKYKEDDLKMPPKEKLPDAVIADIETWIRGGAVYPGGDAAKGSRGPIDLAAARSRWPFQPPREPAIPSVKDAAWAKTPIDRFILAKLEEKGLRPAAPADKATLLRRVTFDLTGLPPTPDETEAFLADDAPDAFSKVVERLLASPHYGERWARHWLDVVRYTDSFDARGIGGEADVPEAWRYRDWVVGAFNRDLPYDQFVRLQVAGDVLPGPGGFSAEGITATGVMAIGNWPVGDADKEKMITDIVDDQVDLVGRGFLGLTLACARCHDHKFDPISTEDYYGLAGIFFSSRILPGPGQKTAGSPVLRIPLAPPSEVEALKKHQAAIAELEKKVEQTANDAYGALSRELLARSAELIRAASEFQRAKDETPAAFAAKRGLPELALRQWVEYLGTGDLGLFTVALKDIRGIKGVHQWKNSKDADTPSLIVNMNDVSAEFGTIKMPPKAVAIHPSPNAGVAVAWRSPLTGAVKVRGRVDDADNVCGDGIEWTLGHVPGHATVELARGAIPNGGGQAVPEKTLEVKAGDLVQLAVLPKREYTCDTTAVELEVEEAGGAKRRWSLTRDVVPDLHEDGQGNPHSDSYGNPDVWCFMDLARRSKGSEMPPDSALSRWFAAEDKEKAAEEVQKALLAADAESLELAKKTPAGKEPPKLKGPDAALYHHVTDPQGPFWAAWRKDDRALPEERREELGRMRRELAELKRTLPPPIPMAHGLQEGGTPNSPYSGIKDTKVHIRGRYDRLGAEVPRRFPKVLAGDAQPPLLQGSGRKELAEWLTSPGNPLVARVMANRLWQYHFGEGIVRTPNNYGKLGEVPLHPELLDHLALEFVRSGWSMKAMHRLILSSAAYRQSSTAEPATFKADPGNLLFGRMSRRRLEAEALRDALLAASGRLDRAMGGKAVMDLATPRRTLYVATVRSDRSNYRALFDAADPTAIVDRRTDSTVAPQALFLLNHPFALAQVRALAERVARQGPADDAARIAWVYPLLYGRAPAEREVKLGLAVLARAREAEAAAGTGASPERVWEPYCQVLLCANEFLYVD